jgi:DNA (cytosine-5)-methyltransferase 1
MEQNQRQNMNTTSRKAADATDSAPTQLVSLFSGIGGFELGFQQADPTAEVVFSSEIDKYARQIYEKNFGVEPHGDIRKINATDVPNHDILMGGFPCQDVSVAGKREGLCGARSGMFFEIVRILREKQPQLVFLENVRGILTSNKGWDFARILIELENVGYSCEWQVFNSKNHGVPQNRERVFLIGHLRGSGTRQIFPITEIKEAVPETWDGEGICAGTLSTRNQSRQVQWDGSTTLIRVNDPTHSNDRIYDPSAASPTLNANGGGNRQPFIMCDSGEGRIDQLRHDVIPPLRANTGAGHNNLVAGCLSGGGHSGGNHSDMTVLNTMNGVRRLTPIECERLQGFPDGWTEGISDTQRYKCLGNAVTVNVVEFIARHMIRMGEAKMIPHLPTHVKTISWKTARRMIEKHHYLGYAPCGCKFALGIYVETELIGTMVFGHPTARLEDQKNTLELTRMFLFDSPKNSESRSLGLAERWIKKNRSETRLISYADTAQGHKGTIYKAANWVQVGITESGSWIRDGRPNRRGIIGGRKLKFERIITNKSKIPTTPPLTSYFGGDD